MEMEMKFDLLYTFEGDTRREDPRQQGKRMYPENRTTNGSEVMEKEEPLITVGACVNWSSHYGTLHEVSQQITNRTTI